jgi:ATP-dependent exoDNAse (exonuclease V) beta subunit
LAELLLFPLARPAPEHEAPSAAPSAAQPDAPARAQALDVQRSFLVEAPAGSGKTGLLIQRFLKLLTDPAVHDPAQVLAITFTLKATAEMRERVLGHLLAARDRTPPRNAFDQDTRPLAEAVLVKDSAAGWNLLDSPQRLNIRTIDAVCAQIARSLPILTGSSGALAPVDPATSLYQLAARRTLMLLGSSDAVLDAALTTLLLHRDGNLADCERLLADMLSWRDQWGELVPLSRPDGSQSEAEFLETTIRPRLERALEAVVCRALTRLARVMPASLQHDFAALAHSLSASSLAGSPIELCRELRSAPGQAAEDLVYWRALAHLALTQKGEWRRALGKNHLKLTELAGAHKAELASLIESCSSVPGLREALCGLANLPPITYPAGQWRIAKALFQVLRRALIELQFVFAETNQCDFTEISLLAKSALRHDTGPGDLTAALGLGLQHLLADEMQDSSTGQYELIQLLTQGWDGHGQTVFLVGDPKQSIYLFRQARVERFLHTVRDRRLGDIPLDILKLTANFRSQPALVEDFNKTFTPIFSATPDPSEAARVSYTAASPARPASSHAAKAFHWHATIVPYPESAADRAAACRAETERQAREIAQIAAQLLGPAANNLASNPTPPKLAVLVRSRTHLHAILPALKLHDVPFRAVEIEPLGQRQEILDLTALTRALLHPADRTAWFALLRSPVCGLTLADLHQLSGADDTAFAAQTVLTLIETRGHELSEDGIRRLSRVYPVLEAANSRRGRLPIAELAERTWHALGASAFLGPEETRNCTRFFALLDQLQQPGGRLSLTILEDHLDRLFAEPSVHPGAVDLLTIHNAKGLEWDVVFVPSLEKVGRDDKDRLLAWIDIEDSADSQEDTGIAPGILAPISGKGSKTDPLSHWTARLERAREAAERKRLFYVACTRAREELHLFAAPSARKDGSLSIPQPSLLAAAWPAAERHFQNLAPAPQPAPVFGIILDMAATAEPVSRSLPLQRIPASYAPPSPRPLFPHAPGPSSFTPPFPRPEGSFAARAYGNAVHAFLEALTQQMETLSGQTPPRTPQMAARTLLAELPAWTPRIQTILRSFGIPPTLLERLTARVLTALSNTLRDPAGLWLLSPHPGAATEFAQLTQPEPASDDTRSIRVDRIFLAGPTPSGQSYEPNHLWIVDYKTTTHGQTSLDAFLEEERNRYAPQLETYAAQLSQPGQAIRLALYYPSLPKLLWW